MSAQCKACIINFRGKSIINLHITDPYITLPNLIRYRAKILHDLKMKFSKKSWVKLSHFCVSDHILRWFIPRHSALFGCFWNSTPLSQNCRNAATKIPKPCASWSPVLRMTRHGSIDVALFVTSSTEMWQAKKLTLYQSDRKKGGEDGEAGVVGGEFFFGAGLGKCWRDFISFFQKRRLEIRWWGIWI